MATGSLREPVAPVPDATRLILYHFWKSAVTNSAAVSAARISHLLPRWSRSFLIALLTSGYPDGRSRARIPWLPASPARPRSSGCSWTSILRALGDSRRTTRYAASDTRDRGRGTGRRRGERPAARARAVVGARATRPTARSPWPLERIVRPARSPTHPAWPAQAAGTGRTTGEFLVGHTLLGNPGSQRLAVAIANAVVLHQLVHLLPEAAPLALFHGEQPPQPHVLFIDGERTGSGQSGAVSGQDVRTNPFARPALRGARQEGAGGEPDHVDRVGHVGGLVDIVDAPHQPALTIPPDAVVQEVAINDADHHRGPGEILANRQDGLGPAPVRGAQKHERALAHLFVLRVQNRPARPHRAGRPATARSSPATR